MRMFDEIFHLISHKTQNLKFKTQNKNKTNIYFYTIKNKNPYYTIVLFIKYA